MIPNLWMIIGIVIVFVGKIGIPKKYGIEEWPARIVGFLFMASGYIGGLPNPDITVNIIIFAFPVISFFIMLVIFGNSFSPLEQQRKINQYRKSLGYDTSEKDKNINPLEGKNKPG